MTGMNSAREQQARLAPARAAAASCGGLVLALAIVAELAGLAAPAPAVVYRGLCDASAVVALDANHFAVADDEDNLLRVYHCDQGVTPIWAMDLSGFLGQPARKPEADIEGAARIGDRVYWVSSHGTNAEGKASPGRRRFFATAIEVVNGSVQLQPIGRPYRGLLTDLAADGRFAAFGLLAAAEIRPKAPGGLSIEGLGATLEGHLLIGFRNPIPGGRALVVRLLNPAELLDGKPARFGEPVLIDLEGLGVRSIAAVHDGYSIIAGPYHSGAGSRLYKWSGEGSPARSEQLEGLSGLNPEGATLLADGRDSGLLVVSDDGNRKAGNKRGKRPKKPAERSFRTAWIPLGRWQQ